MIKYAIDHLYVALMLHMSAHNPKRHFGLSVSGHKARNNGVERALVRTDTVHMLRVENKSTAAILHCDTCCWDHHTRTKCAKVRLNKRHHHAASVRRG